MNAFNVDMELGVGEVVMFMRLRAGMLSYEPATDPPAYAAVAARANNPYYLPHPDSSIPYDPTPTRSTTTTGTTTNTRSGPVTINTERQLPQSPKVNGSVKFGVELGFRS